MNKTSKYIMLFLAVLAAGQSTKVFAGKDGIIGLGIAAGIAAAIVSALRPSDECSNREPMCDGQAFGDPEEYKEGERARRDQERLSGCSNEDIARAYGLYTADIQQK